PTEEVLVRFVAKERLEADDVSDAGISVSVRGELVELFVKAFHRELDVLSELALEPERVVNRAFVVEAELSEDRVALLRQRRLHENADAGLECRARLLGSDVLPEDDARR